MVRQDWQSLNGPWDYSITDPNGSLVEEGVVIVPYCLESMLSNVSHGLQEGHVLTYRKVVRVPEAWIGKWIVLNFEAVDYETEVLIDGEPGFSPPVHKGGFDSFAAYFRATEDEVLVEVTSCCCCCCVVVGVVVVVDVVAVDDDEVLVEVNLLTKIPPHTIKGESEGPNNWRGNTGGEAGW